MPHIIATIPAADGESEIDVRIEVGLDLGRLDLIEHQIEAVRLTGSTQDVAGALSLAQLAAVERAVESHLDELIEQALRDAADELAEARAEDRRG